MRAAPALALLALALPAAADGWPDGAPVAALSGDWNGDGLPDLAVLSEGADTALADLTIYHGGGRRLSPVLSVPGAAFSGPMHGQAPGLTARTATSFVIASEQIAVGRSPWTQDVTVAFRDGAYVVAGFTHGFYDRLDPERGGNCDVNLLTGGWEAGYRPGDGQPERNAAGRDGPRAFPLAEFTADYRPEPCRALFD